MFNRGNYWLRAFRGEFEICIERDKPANVDGTTFPVGTHSVDIILRDLSPNRVKVAKLHYYRLPDGTMTLPDPLRLFHKGIRYGCPHGKRDWIDFLIFYRRKVSRWIGSQNNQTSVIVTA